MTNRLIAVFFRLNIIKGWNMEEKTALKSRATERSRIVEYLKSNLRLTTIDARENLSIMNPAQRISELKKKDAPIARDYIYQADSRGAVHRVAVYIWTGENSAQGDFFGGQFCG